MAATGTPTPNLGLRIPLGTDPASVDDINYNSNALDTIIGDIGDTSVTAQLGAANNRISAVQAGLAIVCNGNTHAAIESGQFAYVKNHGTLAEGLYRNNTGSTIAANATLSSSNLTADSSGGLNTVYDALNSNLQKLASDDVSSISDCNNAKETGIYNTGATATNRPADYCVLYVFATYKNGTLAQLALSQISSRAFIRSYANNSWSSWQELALNSNLTKIQTASAQACSGESGVRSYLDSVADGMVSGESRLVRLYNTDLAYTLMPVNVFYEGYLFCTYNGSSNRNLMWIGYAGNGNDIVFAKDSNVWKTAYSFLTKVQRYNASGIIANSTGAFKGVGYASVLLLPNGIAVVEYTYKVTTAESAQNFAFGLSPALLNGINSDIPTITPIQGGKMLAYNSSGAMLASIIDYGGLNAVNTGRWNPARVYNEQGTVGGYPTQMFALNDIITGVAYGTYT